MLGSGMPPRMDTKVPIPENADNLPPSHRGSIRERWLERAPFERSGYSLTALWPMNDWPGWKKGKPSQLDK